MVSIRPVAISWKMIDQDEMARIGQLGYLPEDAPLEADRNQFMHIRP